MRTLTTIALLAVAALLVAGCSSPASNSGATNTAPAPAPAPAPTPAPASAPSPYADPSKTTSVFGSGSTFAKPVIEAWGLQYASGHPTVQVSYGGGGSGKGRTDIINKNVLFAGSDAPMSATEKAAANNGGNNILQFPETMGPIGVVYNLAGIDTGLKLDGETLGQIYAGKITNWHDGAIAALNPGVSLPDAAIAIVYRSDSSGTTFCFTDFLSKASPTFANTVTASASSKPDWTKSSATQLSGNGNDGVGSTVKTTANSIGYVELSYVRSLNLKVAQMKSHDGEFLAPTTSGASKAAAALATNLPAADGDWSAVSLVNAPGAGTYPIATFTYALVYQNLTSYGGKVSADQQAAFKAWMWWSLHDGQSYSDSLGYAPLPASVVQIGETALASLK